MGSDSATRITGRITGAAIHIPTTAITGHITMLGRGSIGTGAIAFIIGRIIGITATGVNPGGEFRAGGSKSRRHYFFGDAEAPAGADVDVPDADGSENSFFNRSCIAGSSC